MIPLLVGSISALTELWEQSAHLVAIDFFHILLLRALCIPVAPAHIRKTWGCSRWYSTRLDKVQTNATALWSKCKPSPPAYWCTVEDVLSRSRLRQRKPKLTTTRRLTGHSEQRFDWQIILLAVPGQRRMGKWQANCGPVLYDEIFCSSAAINAISSHQETRLFGELMMDDFL